MRVKTLIGQQAGIFREQAEQTADQKMGGRLRRRAVLAQEFGQAGKLRGGFSG